MTKKILCISGWGQKPDSLEFIFNNEKFADFKVESLDYSCFGDVSSLFCEAKKYNPEIVAGWSLGGQLALRLIEAEILRPRSLILIAPPFQMVKDEKIAAAMAKNTFDEFYNNFKNAPDSTLKQFAILMAMNDKHSKEIAKTLDVSDENHDNFVFWLEELERFSFFDFDFSKTPRTLFFQGAGDMIVHESQMRYFQERIADFKAILFKNCGHAPHLSDLARLRDEICGFCKK
jgi:pimeloyl-ACP methyl ester carboxylesterase